MENEIKTGSTPHRSEVNNLVTPLLMITKINGTQMFDGMNAIRIKHGFSVGGSHANIKSCENDIVQIIFS